MKASVHLSDLRGLARMATDATLGVTDLVEAVHQDISRYLSPGPLGMPRRGIAGLVYGGVRGMTRLVGGGVDALLAPLAPRLGGRSSSRRREALLAALNGVLGDHLEAGGNPLAIPMSLKAALPAEAGGKVVVLAHGLCMNDLQWHRRGHDHGAALARDLGYTPVYLHYNSGLHTSINGRAFAGRLETLVRSWPVPVEELVIVGHSMGGLISRSALHYARAAGHEWPRRLARSFSWARLTMARRWSAAATGWTPFWQRPLHRPVRPAGEDPQRGDHRPALRQPAGRGLGETRSLRAGAGRPPRRAPAGGRRVLRGGRDDREEPGDLNDRLLGDGLVSVSSALGRHEDAERSLAIPESRQWVGYGMNHMDLLSRPEVYEQIRRWLAE